MYLGNIFKCFFMIIDLVWTNKLSNMQFMYYKYILHFANVSCIFFVRCLGFLKPRYIPKRDLF